MNLSDAKAELERRLRVNPDPYDEEAVILGYADGAEVCLMGWPDRPVARNVKSAPVHASSADSMQIILEGGMEIYYPDTGETVALQTGDCHVVRRGRVHACVSSRRSMLLVVVGHLAGGSPVSGKAAGEPGIEKESEESKDYSVCPNRDMSAQPYDVSSYSTPPI